MYANNSNIRILIALLKKHGIRHAVVSPGARNLALVKSMGYDGSFKIYSVLDERSAAFFALGLYEEVRKPIIICCTSGTACCGYIPAVTEAFYRGVPLVVISCDRMETLIDQDERQVVPQRSYFGAITRKQVQIYDISDSLHLYEAELRISEALLELDHHGTGPVHINIEAYHAGWANNNVTALEEVRHIRRHMMTDRDGQWEALAMKLKSAKNILVIYGQGNPASNEERNAIEDFASKYDCAVMVDHISNFKSDCTVEAHNLFFLLSPEEISASFVPEIIIMLRGRSHSFIDKFRQTIPKSELWRVDISGGVSDPLHCLTEIFECSPEYFFRFFASCGGNPLTHYPYLEKLKRLVALTSFKGIPFSDIYAVQEMAKALPKYSVLHVAVGRSPELVSFFPIDQTINVYSNEAAYGIDGGTSTFIGHAAESDKLCFLITGDLAYFYDMTALSINHIRNNVRILLLNNGGTHVIPYGTDDFEHLIGCRHKRTAKGWAEQCGFIYLSADDEGDFHNALSVFMRESEKPVLFEVFTDRDKDREIDFTMRNECKKAISRENFKNIIPALREPFYIGVNKSNPTLNQYTLYRKLMYNKLHNFTLSMYFEKYNYKNIAVYGYGRLGEWFVRAIKEEGITNISFIIDKKVNAKMDIPIYKTMSSSLKADCLVVAIFKSAPVVREIGDYCDMPLVTVEDILDEPIENHIRIID